MTRDAATQAQVDAADPNVSTWLAANAGSGKTRVLTDRVARLLLQDVPPERILCLTYTKAAASEMQNRLFQRLGEWAMKGDANLRGVLAELGVPDAPDLTRARALFAEAIEAPGGLKIQTIHAFCAAILRRFPLEAGVSPQFKEMEERAAELLRARIVQDMADGPEAGIVARMTRHLSDADFGNITRAISGAREDLSPPPGAEDLLAALDLPEDHGVGWVWGDVFMPEDRTLLHQLVGVLYGQSPTMVTLAEEIESFGIDRADTALGPFLAGKFLTQTRRPHSTRPTRATRTAMGADWERMEALIDRLVTAVQRPLRIACYEAARDLHTFADAFLPRYAAAKQARGWLDFDDLIVHTRDLLSHSKVAAWVLYRLDGGIDHILVDEAQDTSPVQWTVIDHLAQEFTSGAGAREIARTIFVVGDKKQSIYSFQGADPSEFDRMRGTFRSKLEALQAPFQDAVLEYSFRSAEAVLDVVDKTFEGRVAAGFSEDIRHRAFHAGMPGRVDLWPPVPVSEKPPVRDWTDVVDRRDETHHNVILAGQIATEIKRLLTQEALPARDAETGIWGGRTVQPRDILILVQRRSDLFAEIIRACKKADLPIAGADRLKVGAELAVRDLAALLSWLALPEDDLSLATALRSPLLGWSEQALFTLCHARAEPYLWRTLEARQAQHPDTWTMLRDLRDAADFARPYDLIERVLIRHGGRARLLARLGAEAEDGINALLDQAIAYEGSETPSLTGFLVWMQADDLEIKRQPDTASNQIRVMTVHGAKGLEAPIVILPDCAARKNEFKGHLMKAADDSEPGSGGPVIMKPGSGDMPETLEMAKTAVLERQAQERDRLLYVAMTRAENWLIVGAAGDLGKDGNAWHDRVRGGLERLGAAETDLPGIGSGLRLASGDWPARGESPQNSGDNSEPEMPRWLYHAAPIRQIVPGPLSPSKLGGAKALPGDAGVSEEAAMAYGSRVHRWLEDPGTGLAAPDDPGDPARREAQKVRDHPDFARFFAPGTLAEVTLSASLPGGRRVRGAIDRLLVTPEAVWAVDFKTNRTVPDGPEAVPEGLLRQMGAYAAALAQIYPDRDIRTALLWTAGPHLMLLPHDLVTEALGRATSS